MTTYTKIGKPTETFGIQLIWDEIEMTWGQMEQNWDGITTRIQPQVSYTKIARPTAPAYVKK